MRRPAAITSQTGMLLLAVALAAATLAPLAFAAQMIR